MSSSILTSPFGRIALRTLGMAPLDREFRVSGSMDSMQKLLLVDSGELSDIIFFMPAVKEIHKRYPGIEIHVMVMDSWADLLRKEPGLAGLIVYKQDQLKVRSSSYFRLLKEIRNRAFDCVILMGEHVDPPRDLIAYVSQAAMRLGVFQPERESILNCMVRWRGQDRYKNELAGEMTRVLGLRFDPHTWRFTMRQEESRAAEQMVHFRKPIKDQMLIGIDTSHGKSSKRFSTDNMRYLVDHLIEKMRAKIMLMQIDGSEAKELADFRRRLRGEALDMPSQELRETVAMLSQCSLFVSGNTELFHVAVATGVPSIGLFTESDGVRWEPRRREQVAILRGRPGESVPLSEIDEAIEQVMHASPA
ncbi:MAG: glycosyltransferase family 9 protein [bacterium]|nr:glycosyltransferase family 9 protein [bacterium]